MPTTSNFGWTTPADTDLVKDGAAAIRTLGNGIDASFLDLKGGTTGQILSKASNTDLDYTWITNDVGDITEVAAGTGISGGGTSGAITITNSMATEIDAKGDLVAGTGADTFARLAVGANNTVLTADSSTATGLKWATPTGGANWTLVNAGGTSLTGATTITVSGISNADKIMVLIQSASSASASSVIGIQLNGDTASNYYDYGMRIEAASTYSVDILDRVTAAQTTILLGALSTSSTSTVAGYCLLSGCNSSGVKVFNAAGGSRADGGSGQLGYSHGGYYNSSSTISSVSVRSSSGNFDAGTIFVYTSA